MKKFLIEYRHVEEHTYREWVEAETESEAIEKVEQGEVEYEHQIDGQGLEIIPENVLDEKDEEDEGYEDDELI